MRIRKCTGNQPRHETAQPDAMICFGADLVAQREPASASTRPRILLKGRRHAYGARRTPMGK